MASYVKMNDIIWLEVAVAIDGKWKQGSLSIAEISAFHPIGHDEKATLVVCAGKEYTVNAPYNEFKKVMEKFACS